MSHEPPPGASRDDERRAAGLAAAVQFLTRVPVRRAAPPVLPRAVPWFPTVGAGIGLVLAGIVVALAEAVPMPVAATVTVLAGVVLTGAFHEDGLADVADAFAGGWDREQRLRILTDPLHGSYGVAALTGSILLRVMCLAALAPAVAAAALVAAHALARSAAVIVMIVLPPAKPDGLGASSARAVRAVPTLVGAGAGVAVAALATGWWVGPLAATAAAGAAVMAWLAVRKLGGVTGDVLGAVEQVGECTVLVIVTALAARHGLWWR